MILKEKEKQCSKYSCLFICSFIIVPGTKVFDLRNAKQPLLARFAQKEHQNNLKSKIDLFEFDKVHIYNNGFRQSIIQISCLNYGKFSNSMQRAS